MGIDFDAEKLRLAESFGAITCDLAAGEDPVRAAENWTRGEGVDGVLITASSKSDEVVHQSATMCRKRGRIVLVGVVGLNLRRDDFYKKELSFQVSCSYGPGRYDSNYEGKGLDYPIGYVRWTEQRNFEAVVAMMSQGKISTEQLTTHQFDFSSALEGYKAIHEKGALGILLNYQQGDAPRRQTIELTTSDAQRPPRGRELATGHRLYRCRRLYDPDVVAIASGRRRRKEMDRQQDGGLGNSCGEEIWLFQMWFGSFRDAGR